MAKRRSKNHINVVIAVVIILAAIIGLSIAAQEYIIGFVELLPTLGIAGAFALGFLSSFTLFLPSPAFIAVISMGAVFDPVLVGVAAGIGSAIGEMTGYIVGRGAEAAIHRRKGHVHNEVIRIRLLFNRYKPDVIVFVFATVPLLPIDAMGIFCGAIRYNWKRFLVIVSIGKIIKFTALAFAGSAALALLGTLLGI